MTKICVLPRAEQDLDEIWLWLAQRSSENTANRNVRTIGRRIQELENFPEMGPERHDIAPDARHLVCEVWLILYRITKEGVEIVRIVDGRQDLSRIEF